MMSVYARNLPSNHCAAGSRRPAFVACLLAGVLLLAACGASSTRYYVLDSQPAAKVLPQAQSRSIAIRQIEIPPYLDRPKLVVRDADNQMHIAEYEQWGGHLRDNIARTLADNLAARLEGVAVSVAPFPGSLDADTSLLIDIRRFERMPDGHVQLQLQWHVEMPDGTRITRLETLRSQARTGADDYAAITRAMSSLLAVLSDHMSAAIAGGAGLGAAVAVP